MTYLDKFDPRDLQVVISDLLVATCDHSDPLVDGSVTRVLRQLRDAMDMDFVFVSEFVDGKRVFRHVDGRHPVEGPAVGDHDPLELSYCKQVVDGRLPELVPDVQALPPAQRAALPPVGLSIGAHLSTAVTLDDGTVFGTLCCFSTRPNLALRQQDLVNLQRAATLVARKLDLSTSLTGTPRWTLEPTS
jgi:GAF domain-containing protein